MMKFFKRFLSDKSGQTMTEYALILAVIAAVVIGVAATLGTEIEAAFQSVVDKFQAL